jgi:hypothetical protein
LFKLRDDCELAALVHGMLRSHLNWSGMNQLKSVSYYIMRIRIKCTPRQNTVRITKSKNRRWAQYVGRMGEIRKAYRDFVGKIGANRKT